jgi:hypothetical protein
MDDDPEKRVSDLERQLTGPHAASGDGREGLRDAELRERRERRENAKRLLDEAGISRAAQRSQRVVFRALLALAILGIAAFVAGLIVNDGLVWIGLALFAGAVVFLFALGRARARKIEKVRWQDGTVTFRTVEPGDVGESGQHVECEVELNPTGRAIRVATTVGPLDTQWLAVGATLRCLIDRTDLFVVLRAFPYAQPEGPLPSGREVKFYRATA